MNNPLRTPDDYELFIYTIPERHTGIVGSTVVFVRVGATLARVSGEIEFREGYRLVVRERLAYARLPAAIEGYGYEAWKNAERLYWYDSQPHPDEISLRSTHPHHKHVPPDLKHNRIPAKGMSFTNTNLTVVIEEILELLKRGKTGYRDATPEGVLK